MSAIRTTTPAWRRLLSPLRYIAIKHEMKPKFDFWWPLGFTIISLGFFWALPVAPKFLGDGGFLKSLRDLIALLAAFFVAALAAVATFARENLDKLMEGTSPTLKSRGQSEPLPLTRRQFVCYLFGYLAFIAFALFLSIVAAEILYPNLKLLLEPSWLPYVRFAASAIFMFVFWNMIVTTLLGIYFLVERVHS